LKRVRSHARRTRLAQDKRVQVVRKEMRRVQAMRRKLGAVNLIQRTWRTWKVRAPCLPPLYSGMSSTRQRLILPLLRSTVRHASGGDAAFFDRCGCSGNAHVHRLCAPCLCNPVMNSGGMARGMHRTLTGQARGQLCQPQARKQRCHRHCQLIAPALITTTSCWRNPGCGLRGRTGLRTRYCSLCV